MRWANQGNVPNLHKKPMAGSAVGCYSESASKKIGASYGLRIVATRSLEQRDYLQAKKVT